MIEDALFLRRKRALHRARYRGCLEADLLLGRFAAQFVPRFDADELAAFERLLDEADVDILAWYCGRRPAPARHDNEVFRLLRSFEPKA
ncbi:hypothetical protein HRbin40_01886 [bacterium HR40]|nr:hypothetical protein HRbin40_01886 [bacterium HR40]